MRSTIYLHATREGFVQESVTDIGARGGTVVVPVTIDIPDALFRDEQAMIVANAEVVVGMPDRIRYILITPDGDEVEVDGPQP